VVHLQSSYLLAALRTFTGRTPAVDLGAEIDGPDGLSDASRQTQALACPLSAGAGRCARRGN
jgi:hypothetical protein